MKRLRVPLFAVVVFTFMLASQQAPGQEKQMPSQKGQMKPMDNMPMEHQQAAMKSIDQMNTTMEAATQSNDPAKMRAAIDQAKNSLWK
jgi:hypothetical protein